MPSLLCSDAGPLGLTGTGRGCIMSSAATHVCSETCEPGHTGATSLCECSVLIIHHKQRHHNVHCSVGCLVCVKKLHILMKFDMHGQHES